MTVINTNTAALSAQYHLSQVNKEMEQAMERLSSGKRINSAADDAAGLTIASRMDSQIRGLSAAIRNANDGISAANTAEGAMEEIESMLQRMREIAIQSANNTYTATDRENLDNEVAQLKSEIDRVVNTTTFNSQRVLDGTFSGNLQIGAFSGETMDLSINNMGTASLGSLTGLAASQGVTEASVQGKEANSTITQLTFNGDDSYEFKLTTAVDGGDGVYVIKGDVSNNSASDIVAKINAAIRDTNGAGYKASAAQSLEVSYTGNVVTIKNNYGGTNKVEQNSTNALSASGSTIGFTSVHGDQASNNLVLGTANSFTGTTIENDNAYAAATKSTAEVTHTTAAEAGEKVKLTLTATGGSTVEFETAALATTANDALGKLLTAFDGLSDKKGFTVAHDTTNNKLTIERADGDNFTITANYTDDAAATAAVALSAQPGGAGAAAALAEATASAASTDGTAAVGEEISNMYLDVVGADTYSFTFTDSASTPNNTGSFDVTYDGTSAGLSAMATAIETKIDATFDAQHDVSVKVEGGRLKISDANGQAFKLSGFASAGSGTIMASVDTGQGDTTIGDGVLLDDTSYATTASTLEDTDAGEETKAVASVAKLTFGATDRYSFNISDGSATAVIGNFNADITSTATTTSIASEMNVALTKAGLGDIIVAAADATTAGLVTLTHKNGKEIAISNFKSDSTGTVKVEAGNANNSGFTKVLDDGGASAATVSGVDVKSASNATAAIDILDRALEDVASERATLGAAVNRLDHTINNLSNVSTSTAAAKSQIVDADFAAETSALTKTQILSQAATSMLAQANQSKQSILALLQG